MLNPEKLMCSSDLVTEQMEKLPESTTANWSKFRQGKLAEINERNTIVPAASYSNAMSSSEDDDAEFRDLQFPQAASLQQVSVHHEEGGHLFHLQL